MQEPETAEPQPADQPLWESPKVFAVVDCNGNRGVLLPVRRCKVTTAALANAELGSGVLNDVKLRVYLVREPEVMEKLKPYVVNAD